MNPGYIVKTGGATALAAATAKTLINLIAAATVGVQLREIAIAFDGVTASGIPVLIEICQSTQAGAGTPGTSPTPAQYKGRAITVGVTAGESYSVEPTALTAIWHTLVTPNGGTLIIPFAIGDEFETDLSGGTIKALAIRATAPAIVNVRAAAKFERL